MGDTTRKPLLAVVDLGSSSVKAVLAWLDHPTGWCETKSWPTPVVNNLPDQSEFEPEALDALLDQVIAWLPDAAADTDGTIKLIAITGQVGGVLLLNNDGRLQRPCLTWADRRGVDQAQAFGDQLGHEFPALLGHELPVQSCWSAPKIRRLFETQPKRMAVTSCVMQLPDYLYYRLTGLRQTVPTLALTLAHQSKHTYAQKILDWTGLKPEQLPAIHGSAAVGALSEQVMNQWKGITDHRPFVVLAGADMFCSMVGLACEDDESFIQAGTTEIAGAPMAHDQHPTKPKAVIRLDLPMLGSNPNGKFRGRGGGVVYGSTNNGGMSLVWLAKELGVSDLDAPEHQALWAKAAALEPDPAGVLFVPHVNGGRAPLWRDDAQGGFVGGKGIQEESPARLLRAVVEGCAMSKRSVLEAVGEGGTPRRQVIVAGGGARRAMVNQIRADVLGLPVVARRLVDVAAAGAGAIAIKAAASPEVSNLPGAAQWLAGFHEAMGQDVFSPDTQRVQIYELLYQRYLASEQALLPRLSARVTGRLGRSHAGGLTQKENES